MSLCSARGRPHTAEKNISLLDSCVVLNEWDILRVETFTKCVEEVSTKMTDSEKIMTDSEIIIKVTVARVSTITPDTTNYGDGLLEAQKSIVDGV